MKHSNILDSIHDALDPRVFNNPADPKPELKQQHRTWINDKVYAVLHKHGYHDVEKWLGLVFTGSLTTYQYSDLSDVDISLFVDAKQFPEWSRAEMIAVMVSEIDGTLLPGTPFPMQCFVVPPEIKRADLYKKGLRSGYDLQDDKWIVPPEPDRVHDVQTEMNGAYIFALESADKMERLLRYEPDKAVDYWHQVHKRRRRDQQAGKGDYSLSNIVYKFLANRGIFPKLSDLTGEYIANTKEDAWKNSTNGSWKKLNGENNLLPKSNQSGTRASTIRDSMAADPMWWKNFRQPLYHVTDRNNLESIKKHGLLPWDHPMVGKNNWEGSDPKLQPRPGHIYMASSEKKAKEAASWGMADRYALLRIDPKALHAENINADEDAFDENGHHGKNASELGFPTTASPYLLDKSLGEWADDNIQDPEHTQYSHEASGSLAHRGRIPAEAIHVVSDDWDHYSNFDDQDVDDRDPTHIDYHPDKYKTTRLASLDEIVEKAFEAAPGGGITIRPDGVEPTEGYAFSPFKGSEVVIPLAELKPGDIAQFLTTNQASWGDQQNFLGLWLNESNIYIDVVQVKPDFDEAYSLAWDNNQEAMWDITNSQEIPVRDGGLPPKTAVTESWSIDPRAIDKAAIRLGLKHPAKVNIEGGTYGQYQGLQNGVHIIKAIGWLKPSSANEQIWHELIHAKQAEGGMEFPDRPKAYDDYRAQPHEQEAHNFSPPFSVVLPRESRESVRVGKPMHRIVRKWVYNADGDRLVIGEVGPEEGSVLSHNQLAPKVGVDFVTSPYHLGTINKMGYVTFEGGGKTTNARTRFGAQQAIKKALPGEKLLFLGGEISMPNPGVANDEAAVPNQWNFG